MAPSNGPRALVRAVLGTEESLFGDRFGDDFTMTVRIQAEPFDIAAEVEALAQGRHDIGAVVTFTGLCRGEEADGRVGALTLEHYPGMAEMEIERHVAEAQKRWSLKGVTVVHRYGRLTPGDLIVLVATASSHRHDAFAAAEFLMDYLKTRAPFWKREERSGEARWVVAHERDDAALARWSER